MNLYSHERASHEGDGYIPEEVFHWSTHPSEERVPRLDSKSVLLPLEIVRHWKTQAADRQTIVFCSTVEHAQAVA